MDANGCIAQGLGTPIIVTVTATGNLGAGLIGTSQGICYNTAPLALTEITAPSGGSGEYAYQWQSSLDNTLWTDIDGATLSGYSPGALTVSTYYRRMVTSSGYEPAYSGSVVITVSPEFTLAQLHDDLLIDNNTSATFSVVITGGTSPYTINYTRNGDLRSEITGYVSGSAISTGILEHGGL